MPAPSAWALKSWSWSRWGTVQDRSYVATSVGAGRLPLADSTRGGSRDRRFKAPGFGGRLASGPRLEFGGDKESF